MNLLSETCLSEGCEEPAVRRGGYCLSCNLRNENEQMEEPLGPAAWETEFEDKPDLGERDN